MEKRLYTHNRPFELECGGRIEELEICYHISTEHPKDGRTGKEQKKVIWITHALTANSDPCDWWDVLVGEGKFFDPRKYTIVCANILGSCYGSTSPCSINPETGKPYLLDFPQTTVRDVATCHNILLEHLGIDKVDLLIGGSVGGFQALEWSIMFPEKIRNMVLLASNSRFTPWGSAFNESMRMALFADPTFQQQEYTILEEWEDFSTRRVGGKSNRIIGKKIEPLGGKVGLAAARSVALISYRSFEGYNTTQFEQDEDCIFPQRAGSYQRYQGKKLVDRFDAYSYLSMINLTDSHNIGRHRGGVEKALGMVKANTVCVGIDSDGLFPVNEQKFMAEHIPEARYREISSAFGHDGFLLEWEQIKEVIESEELI